MQIPDVNLEAIPDLATRQLVGQLLNLIEALAAENAALRIELQQQRDDLARLKGASPRPEIKPPVPPAATDHSSEAERQPPTPRGKPKQAKNATLTVTCERPYVVDPTALPRDATRSGTTETIVQDLVLTPEVIRFVREVWFVPGTRQTITAPLPEGYHGGFGPHVRTFRLDPRPRLGQCQPARFAELSDRCGAGYWCRYDCTLAGRPHGQLARRGRGGEVHLAGLASGPWQATDQTSTRVDGRNEVCHVVGNDLFTSYHTRPGGTRQDVLAVLWDQEPFFRLNEDALAWLAETSCRPALQFRLRAVLPWDCELTAAELHARLLAAGIILTTQQHQQVCDALAVAAYHAQTGMPIVRWLLSDDAAVYHWVTDEHGLCWVHDGRHYAKLSPVVLLHQQQLADFRRAYWAFYRELVTYRAAPSASERERLAAAFDQLVARRTGYDDLDARIAKTAANRELLLAVLDYPALPLHNNAIELAARRRVQKRDVSFGPQSRAGAQAWDSFQTIAATAAKLGVRRYHYFRDRLMHPATTPSLAELIRARSGAAALNPS